MTDGFGSVSSADGFDGFCINCREQPFHIGFTTGILFLGVVLYLDVGKRYSSGSHRLASKMR